MLIRELYSNRIKSNQFKLASKIQNGERIGGTNAIFHQLTQQIHPTTDF